MATKRGSRGGKSERHFILLDNRLHYVPAPRWHSWIVAGLLILVADRVAKPIVPVIRIENGVLRYPEDPRAPWMPLNCRQWESKAIYFDAGRRYFITPEERQRAIQRQYEGWE